MKKLIFCGALLCLFSVSPSEARFIVKRSADNGTKAVVTDKTDKDTSKVVNTSSVKSDSQDIKKQNSVFVETNNEDIEKKVSSKSDDEKTEREKLIEAVGKGSISLMRTISNNANKGRNNFEAIEKQILNNRSKEEVEARRAANRKRFEEASGMTIEEANNFYSEAINKDKNKRVKIVSDELDEIE